MILLLTSISLLAVGSHPPVLDFFQMLEPPAWPLTMPPRMSPRDCREFSEPPIRQHLSVLSDPIIELR